MIESAPTQGGAPLNIPVEDWDILFRAVEERLTRMVDERHAATDHSGMHDMRGSARETVLECVAALDQLHAALAHERARYHQLERDMRELQAHNHRVSTM